MALSVLQHADGLGVRIAGRRPARALGADRLAEGVAGVEGLRVLGGFNGLRESGAIAHPHIILGNPGDCPTRRCRAPPRPGRGGRKFKSCHSDQLFPQKIRLRGMIWELCLVRLRLG
jgi:hypothetical protein